MAFAETVRARHLDAGQGKQGRVITDVVTIKALAADTGGAYSLFEVLTPPAGGCPPHAQRYEEETVYVLEGRYAFLLDEETLELGAGDYVFVPRGMRHAFTNIGSEPARLLLLVTPGGIHDQFFAEVGDHAARHPWQPDIAKVLAVAPKYGIEFSSPDVDGEAGQPGW
jgi:quercetin dioxygenase-like cupin family protein